MTESFGCQSTEPYSRGLGLSGLKRLIRLGLMITTVAEWEAPFKAWLKVHYHPSSEHKVPVTSVYKHVVETFGTQIAIAGMGRIVKATFPSVRRMCMGKRGTKGYFYYGLKEKGNSENSADSDNPDAPIDVGDVEYDEQDMKIASNGNNVEGPRINGTYNHGQVQRISSQIDGPVQSANGMVSMNYPSNEHSVSPMDLSSRRGGLTHMRKDNMANKAMSENNNRLSPSYGKDREMAAIGNENAPPPPPPPPVQKERERSHSALPPKKQIADRVAISQASEMAAANTFRGSSPSQRSSHNGAASNSEAATTVSRRPPGGGVAPSFQSIIEQAIDRSFADDEKEDEESESTATEHNSDESNSSATQENGNGNPENGKQAAPEPAREQKAASPIHSTEHVQNLPVSLAQTVAGHRVNFHDINSLMGPKLAEMNARLAEQARLGAHVAALNPQALHAAAAADQRLMENRSSKPDSRPSSRSSTDSSTGKRKSQARSPGQGRKKSKMSTSSPPEGEISQQSRPESRPSSRSSASSGHAQSGSESPVAMSTAPSNHPLAQQPNYESTPIHHPTAGAENLAASPPRPEVTMANPMFSAVRFPPNLPADFSMRMAQEPMFQRDCNCTSGLAARQLKSRVIGLEVEIDLMRHQNEHLKYLLIRERGEKDILVDRLQELERKLEQSSSSR